MRPDPNGIQSEGGPVTNPESAQSSYRVMRFRSWPAARRFGTAFPRHSQMPGGDQFWCFRGQSDESWGLETALEREGKRCGLPPQGYADRERLMLREFHRRGHLHGDRGPADANAVELLALVQHHGGSTRLLDFTYSFYVACFFALESAEHDAAVWIVNLGALRRAIARKEGFKEWGGLIAFSDWSLARCTDVLGRATTDSGIVLVDPYHMSERLAAQQGLFLFPLSIAASFEENLIAALDLPAGCFADGGTCDYGDDDSFGMEIFVPKVMKVVLPREIHHVAMKDLRQTNITAASLFPGLDGFARSLRWYLTP